MTVTPNPESVTPTPVAATDGVATATSQYESREEQMRRVAAEYGITVPELAERIERLRDVATSNQRDASLCSHCEGPMPAQASPSQRYCSENCRKEASRDRVARRREAAERAARGEKQGTCDVCGRACDVKNALCDGCIDDLNERNRAALETSHVGEENDRG